MLKGTQLVGFGARRGVAAGGESTVVWNTSDKDADITLSNGDRDTAGSGAGSVRATLSHASSGKYYWEVTIITGSPGNLYIGLMNSTASVANTYPGSTASSAGVASFGNAVNTWTKAQAGTFSIALNDVLGFAVDLSAGYMWVAKNNSWLLSGDPAAGTSPWVTGITGTVFPVIGYVAAYGTGGRISAEAAQQSYSPPSGFSTWASA